MWKQKYKQDTTKKGAINSDQCGEKENQGQFQEAGIRTKPSKLHRSDDQGMMVKRLLTEETEHCLVIIHTLKVPYNN